MVKKKIITDEDKFLEQADVKNMQPLDCGTASLAGEVVKAFPQIKRRQAWDLINEQLHKGKSEAEALRIVLEHLADR